MMTAAFTGVIVGLLLIIAMSITEIAVSLGHFVDLYEKDVTRDEH